MATATDVENKPCPKCEGWLVLSYGDLTCLNCGYAGGQFRIFNSQRCPTCGTKTSDGQVYCDKACAQADPEWRKKASFGISRREREQNLKNLFERLFQEQKYEIDSLLRSDPNLDPSDIWIDMMCAEKDNSASPFEQTLILWRDQIKLVSTEASAGLECARHFVHFVMETLNGYDSDDQLTYQPEKR